ncbi:hypothetical protein GL2_35970 [Microbulbifer sp. GL-2]|nr:hypothetical protein GL2_35970 [Microbulbifer sp. GL-2]
MVLIKATAAAEVGKMHHKQHVMQLRTYDTFAKDARIIEITPVEIFWAEHFALLTDKYGMP